MKIKHITLRVKDLEKSINFYEMMTGIKVVRRLEVGDAKLAFLSNGDGETEIELLNIKNGESFSGKGMFICFETKEIEVMHEKAIKNALNPSAIQKPEDGTKYFYMYDPDGVSIQLREFKTL